MTGGGPFRDEGAAGVEDDRRRERETEHAALQAQTRAFAGQLRPRTRTLLLLLGLAGTAAVLVAAFGPWRHRTPVPPAAAPPRPLDSAACASLASRYQTAWHSRNTCSTDDECVALPRGGYWAGLDGCARFGPRAASSEADAIAAAWLAGGCAKDFALCGKPGGAPRTPPEAQCRSGTCAELPPSPIPRDWQRVDAGLFQFFGPPGLHGGRAVVDDGIGYLYEGHGMGLSIEYDEYAPVDIHPGEAPDLVVVTGRTPVFAHGHAGTDVAFEERRPDGGPPSYRRVLAMTDAPCQRELTFSTCDGPEETTRLAIWATCDRREACDDARTVFESIEFP